MSHMAVDANAVVRTTERCWEHCLSGQFEAAGELMADDFVHDDRRRGLTNVIMGRDATLENNGLVAEMGFTPVFEPLLVRGDDLALARVTFRNAAGDVVESLQLLGLDAGGRRTWCVSFGADDVGGATAEFHRRAESVCRRGADET